MNGKRRNIGSAAVVLCFVLPLAVSAGQSQTELRDDIEALKKAQEAIQNQIQLMREIEALKKGQDEIRKELADIKALLQQPAARTAAPNPAAPSVQNVLFDLGANPVKGENTAQLTLVEFTDYQ